MTGVIYLVVSTYYNYSLYLQNALSIARIKWKNLTSLETISDTYTILSPRGVFIDKTTYTHTRYIYLGIMGINFYDQYVPT